MGERAPGAALLTVSQEAVQQNDLHLLGQILKEALANAEVRLPLSRIHVFSAGEGEGSREKGEGKGAILANFGSMSNVGDT